MREDIELKTSQEVDAIRSAAAVVELVLAHARQFIAPGRTTAFVEAQCAMLLRRHGAVPDPSQTGGFPGAVCVSVNEAAAHGVPGDYVLAEGDVVTLDVTACVNGWHADGAWTYVAGEATEQTRQLVRAAWLCALNGVRAIKAGRRIGDIGAAVQETARRLGCRIFNEFAGHGIGRRMHEPPTVYHSADVGTGEPIVPGIVLTVEPIVSFGVPRARKAADGWTYIAEDGSWTAQFEHTVAVFSGRTEVLTMPALLKYVDFPPFF